jgi:UDP-N-acetylmuramyl pentapeptide phosphotransferase/UDP-N-acetylglucosamine-1-phosphate transferase
MNAVNFLDNMNGMLTGLVAIGLLAFACGSAARGAVGVATAQLVLAGACIGFLPYNFPSARIFLGDAGSLLLGYSLGASAVLAFADGPQGWGQFGPVIALAYPTFDMLFVVITRLRDGRKIYQGGRDHTNHTCECPEMSEERGAPCGPVGPPSPKRSVSKSPNRAWPALVLAGLVVLLMARGSDYHPCRIETTPPSPSRSRLPSPALGAYPRADRHRHQPRN